MVKRPAAAMIQQADYDLLDRRDGVGAVFSLDDEGRVCELCDWDCGISAK